MATPRHICNYGFGTLANFDAVLRCFTFLSRGFAVFGPPGMPHSLSHTFQKARLVITQFNLLHGENSDQTEDNIRKMYRDAVLYNDIYNVEKSLENLTASSDLLFTRSGL